MELSLPLIAQPSFENAVLKKRYSERALVASLGILLAWDPIEKLSLALSGFLRPKQVQDVNARIIRAVYLIEPVNVEVTSTKYATRWSDKLASNDPRRATFADCLAIHESVCAQIVALVGATDVQDEIASALKWAATKQEFPIDYKVKRTDRIHLANNIEFFTDPDYLRLLKLREALLSPKLNPDVLVFRKIIEKIRVKSYLTDRAQTGDFQTNREKRWEAHPASPQFARRRDCLLVELKLIEQVISFANFPVGTVHYLVNAGLIANPTDVARCPITLDPLDFEVLAHEVSHKTHGKSAFQVGHLNPLKAGAGKEFRHNRENISWVSEDGNRIQGYLTLDQTRALLKRISQNYQRLLPK